jgi:hypothetical protein
MESVAKDWARLTIALAGIGSLPPSPLFAPVATLLILLTRTGSTQLAQSAMSA